jgi:hypothetical protein
MLTQNKINERLLTLIGKENAVLVIIVVIIVVVKLGAVMM